MTRQLPLRAHGNKRVTLAWMSTLGLLAACDGATTTEPGACFPVPAGAQALRWAPDPSFMPNQGTSLQGEANIMQNQGTSLQGEANIMQNQGTSLQGEANIMQNQGTSLQGTANGMQLQGTSLQGGVNGMQTQGTSLQHETNGMRMQGTSLQGASDVQRQQGTSPHGRLDGIEALATSPQHGTNGMQMQGTSLQGESNLMEQQGTALQGDSSAVHARAAGRQAREYRGLRDLNGARLTIAADPSNAVRVQDGELVAQGFASTESLRGTALSATAPDGRQLRVEIIAVTRDTGIARVEIFVEGVTACQPGKQGVFVAGRWDAQAAFVDDPGVVTYACMDGVIAKCVDWGYAPWLTDASVHAGCTRMARADYCGNGTPWTLDGTTISVFDTLGIHEETTAADMTFEAAWGPSGALCVAKSRYAIQDASANTVVPSCFATLPRCKSLDDAAARGATLANRSRVMPIDACE